MQLTYWWLTTSKNGPLNDFKIYTSLFSFGVVIDIVRIPQLQDEWVLGTGSTVLVQLVRGALILPLFGLSRSTG